jgi:hypothetical protein
VLPAALPLALPAAELAENKTIQDKKDAPRDIAKMKQGEKCLALREDLAASGYRTIGEFLLLAKGLIPRSLERNLGY